MVTCCAVGCTSNKKCGYSFHVFPHNISVRNKWIVNVRRKDWMPSRHSRLCSRHFTEDQFDRTSGKMKLKPHAVPTVFCFKEEGKCRKSTTKPLVVRATTCEPESVSSNKVERSNNESEKVDMDMKTECAQQPHTIEDYKRMLQISETARANLIKKIEVLKEERTLQEKKIKSLLSLLVVLT